VTPSANKVKTVPKLLIALLCLVTVTGVAAQRGKGPSSALAGTVSVGAKLVEHLRENPRCE
jgi:hypothetical protein